MLPVWFEKILLYGHIGVILEFWFTGARSLFNRHWKLTTSSYLWMLPVYGVTGLLMEVVGASVVAPFWAKAFLFVPLIYGAEALSGATLAGLTGFLERFLGGAQGGVIPWEYQKSNWAPFGLVNFRYAPFWYLLALAFDPISHWILKVISVAGQL